MNTTQQGIIATLTQSDRKVIKFDAAPWFEEADDVAIKQMAGLGDARLEGESYPLLLWGADIDASAVAIYCHTFPSKRLAMPNDDLNDALSCTLEAAASCKIDGYSAMKWLKAHREPLFFEMLCEMNGQFHHVAKQEKDYFGASEASILPIAESGEDPTAAPQP